MLELSLLAHFSAVGAYSFHALSPAASPVPIALGRERCSLANGEHEREELVGLQEGKEKTLKRGTESRCFLQAAAVGIRG